MLGTELELRITAPDAVVARRAEDAALDTVDRLEALLSVHRADSALVRWRSGLLDDPGQDVREVLALAARWWSRSGGVVHPATGGVTARWRRAAEDGVVPDADELDALAAALRALPYEVDGRSVRRLSDCTGVDLNAVAKGWIVDRVCEAALAVAGVEAVVVNAGGDLVHAGTGSTTVRVADGRSVSDAVPERIVVAGAAVATSGAAHRGFRVGDHWFSHVLDPRDARPVDHVRAATVVAPDAATADAVATVVGVLAVDEALGFVDGLDDVACRLVVATGDVVEHPRWAGRRAGDPG